MISANASVPRMFAYGAPWFERCTRTGVSHSKKRQRGFRFLTKRTHLTSEQIVKKFRDIGTMLVGVKTVVPFMRDLEFNKQLFQTT